MSFNLIMRMFLIFTILSTILLGIKSQTNDIVARFDPRNLALHGRRQTQQIAGENGQPGVYLPNSVTCTASNEEGYTTFDLADCDTLSDYIITYQVACAQYKSCAWILKTSDVKDVIDPKKKKYKELFSSLKAADIRYSIHAYYDRPEQREQCKVQIPLSEWLAATNTPIAPDWLGGRLATIQDPTWLAETEPRECDSDLAHGLST